MAENLEKKVSPAKSSLVGGLVGATADLLFPGVGLVGKVVDSILYGCIVAPLFRKLFRKGKAYQTTPYSMGGYFGGSYIPTLLRYVV